MTNEATDNQVNQQSSTALLTYLTTEFDHSQEMWKHEDERLDKEVQYYFLLVGIVATFIGLLAQLHADLLSMLVSIWAVALLVGVAGYRLLRRIVMHTGHSALYCAQVGVLRRGFMALSAAAEDYMILNNAGDRTTAHYYTPIISQLAVRMVILGNSLIAAALVVLASAIAYVALPSLFAPATWYQVFAGTVIVGIVVAALAYRNQRHVVASGDRFLNHITRTVQGKPPLRLLKESMRDY